MITSWLYTFTVSLCTAFRLYSQAEILAPAELKKNIFDLSRTRILTPLIHLDSYCFNCLEKWNFHILTPNDNQ